MKSKVLIGKKYLLRIFTAKDISKEYIDWLNNSKVNAHLEVRHNKQTKEGVNNYIESFHNSNNKYLWGIYDIKTKKHIGTVNIIVSHYNSAEIGLMIGDMSFWGELASDEAISLVLDFSFNELKIHRVSGGCYAENIGMNFTFNRLGFRREAVFKESVIKINGQYSDIFKWAILSKEWGKKC
jgi:RimJ/RimL family protein N-acetyltransferase